MESFILTVLCAGLLLNYQVITDVFRKRGRGIISFNLSRYTLNFGSKLQLELLLNLWLASSFTDYSCNVLMSLTTKWTFISCQYLLFSLLHILNIKFMSGEIALVISDWLPLPLLCYFSAPQSLAHGACSSSHSANSMLTGHMGDMMKFPGRRKTEEKRSSNLYTSFYRPTYGLSNFMPKRYTCTKCSQSFSYPGNLSRHRKACEGNFDIKCHLCDKIFYRQDMLKLHLKNKHGISAFHINTAGFWHYVCMLLVKC